MYRSGRLKYPLKRVGERGSRQWKRVSWDEAIEGIAKKMVVAIRDKGGDSVVTSMATHAVQPSRGGAAKLRFSDLIGGTVIDNYGDIGDGQTGTMMTTGIQSIAAPSDTMMESKCIINWAYNPSYTRIPDAHFQWEARYNGATIVTIAPDQNATAMHSDLWLNPKPGSDVALAMAMAHIIVRDNLIDREHMKEQTDLPFLIRSDNAKFLRVSDVEQDGSDAEFYFWDLNTKGLAKTPGSMGSAIRSIDIGKLDPALEGSWEVALNDGSAVTVRPAFELLKEHLDKHTPELAYRETGVGVKSIERVTKVYSAAKPALINIGWGLPRLFNGDTLARAITLLSALTGNTGRVGGGYHTGGINHAEAMDKLYFPEMSKTGKHRFTPGPAWMYVHGGFDEYYTRYTPDAANGKPASAYVEESIEKGWMPVYPEKGRDPSVLIECGSNILRRTRLNQVLRDKLWPKLDLVLTIDYRMTSTALESDYVLPAAGFYEMEGIKLTEQKVPHHVYVGKAVEPFAESRDEWTIFSQISKKISELAPAMGLDPVWDEHCDLLRDYSKLYDRRQDRSL